MRSVACRKEAGRRCLGARRERPARHSWLLLRDLTGEIMMPQSGRRAINNRRGALPASQGSRAKYGRAANPLEPLEAGASRRGSSGQPSRGVSLSETGKWLYAYARRLSSDHISPIGSGRPTWPAEVSPRRSKVVRSASSYVSWNTRLAAQRERLTFHCLGRFVPFEFILCYLVLSYFREPRRPECTQSGHRVQIGAARAHNQVEVNKRHQRAPLL